MENKAPRAGLDFPPSGFGEAKGIGCGVSRISSEVLQLPPVTVAGTGKTQLDGGMASMRYVQNRLFWAPFMVDFYGEELLGSRAATLNHLNPYFLHVLFM